MDVHVDAIAYNSEAYRHALALRYRVLREPLGLTYTPEQLAREANDLHLVAILNGSIVGTLILTRVDEQTGQMRQVAVDTSVQGQGIGRALVHAAEMRAREQGFATLVLHARVAAEPFYGRLGYAAVGEPFEEVTLPHIEMRKTLVQHGVNPCAVTSI